MNKVRQEVNPSHEQIALVAYELWEKDGCKEGHALDYWLEAERRAAIKSISRRQGKLAHQARHWQSF